jgi:NAD-dependent dihydropyrimidine dehydrogenase PreA subunit
MTEIFPKIKIDLKRCDGCGTYIACVETCPMSNYEIKELEPSKKRAFPRENYECLGCKKCVAVCPTGAIEIITE